MTEIIEFEENLHKKGIYHFREMSLDKQYEDFLYEWTEFLYEPSEKKYNFHIWLNTYQHDSLFDYSTIDLAKHWYDDSEEHIERFNNFSDYIKQFLYRARNWLDDNCISTNKNNETGIENDDIETILKNYTSLKKVLESIGASNLPNNEDLKNKLEEIRNNNDKEEVDRFIRYAVEDCTEYDEYQRFFFIVPQMKNIKISDNFDENDFHYISASKTVWFNDNYMFSVSHEGDVGSGDKTITIKTNGEIEEYSSPNSSYINHIKKLMTFFGLETTNINFVSDCNDYFIKLFSSRSNDYTSYESIYDQFEF